MFPLQKCQLPRVPGLTFVALTPSVVYCHCMNMARFQGPGVQRARGLIKLAQDIFLAGFEEPGRMEQSEEHWERKSE